MPMDCILLHQNAAPMTHFFAVMTIKRRLARYPIVFKRYIIISVMLVSALVEADAQYDASFSHYFDMEPSFNAGAVGKESKLNVSAAYAMDFAGFKHNPRTMYVGADMPLYFLKSYHGVGLQFMNDKIGLFTHQRLALQYALRLKMFGGQLAAGVSAGLLSETFDGTQLDLEPGFHFVETRRQLCRPGRCSVLHSPQLVRRTVCAAPQLAAHQLGRQERAAD